MFVGLQAPLSSSVYLPLTQPLAYGYVYQRVGRQNPSFSG